MNLDDYVLRKVEIEDKDTILAWRNQERIRKFMYSDAIISKSEHQQWFVNMLKNQTILFYIFEIKRKPVGVVNFYEMDTKNEKCSWGFYLGEENTPRGSGTIMGYLGLKLGFEELGVRKVTGEVFDFNTASIKFHEKLGFIQEGRLTRHLLKDGEYKDILIYSAFSDNWIEYKREIEKQIEQKILNIGGN